MRTALNILVTVIWCLLGTVWRNQAAEEGAQDGMGATNTAVKISDKELKELLAQDPSLAKELELLKIRNWDGAVSLTTGGGYKDNVLMGYANRESSGFVRNSMELTLWRLPINRWQIYFFALGDDLRFLDGKSVKQEQMALLMGTAKKTFDHGWQLGISAQYLYFDQVMDISTDQGEFAILPVVAHSFVPRVSLRKYLGTNNWVEMECSVNRQEFKAPLDDYWESGPKLTLGHSYANKSDISLSYEFGFRSYDTRLKTDETGLALSQSELAYTQHKLSLNWKHHFDARQRWRAATRLTMERNMDNASGYFDYWKYQVSEQLRYVQKRWEIRGQIRATKYDYLKQRLSASNLEKIERTELSASLRGEIGLCKNIKYYVEYEFERSLSNRIVNEYEVNTCNTGLIWEF